ncbi:hypothetical protein CPLU01_11662 [Colletotrichum plurivorum]|uniref:Uncharacterized protein n=1 Tax=Colletotrichum plurivorum TaxID=2175906 RepID=A0A8H6N7Z0_9PEZI|nr:hypothetical protein CPLU01_11662 [Colletotrichum plurivorum]
MPTVVRPQPSTVGVNRDSAVKSARDLLRDVSRQDFFQNEILHTSFKSLDASAGIVPAENGFSQTIIRAFQQDLHLTLRPDDVWLAVLVQVSFFIGNEKRAEELRHNFVAHKGREHVSLKGGEKLVYPEIATVLLPEFSTTTKDDRAAAAIAFLGAMKNYVTYEFKTGCGFPSVTFLGTRDNWVKMQDGLDFLATLGDETIEWVACLSKVLKYMVASFDKPDDEDVKDFWMRAVHYGRKMSGEPRKLSGWLTAFSWWDPVGDRLESFKCASISQEYMTLDGVEFPVIKASKIPMSITRCPVVIDDQKRGICDAEFLAGIPGFQVQDDSRMAVRPVSGWWLLAPPYNLPGPPTTHTHVKG